MLSRGEKKPVTDGNYENRPLTLRRKGKDGDAAERRLDSNLGKRRSRLEGKVRRGLPTRRRPKRHRTERQETTLIPVRDEKE